MREEVTKLKQARAIEEVFLSKMTSKYCGGKEEEWEVASVRRFHGLE